MRLSLALGACVIACGGRAIDDGVESGRPPAEGDDSAAGGHTWGSPSETGGEPGYFGTAERSGESWQAHVWPAKLILDVGRWEGAIVEETYVNNELIYINVSQERAFTYPLLITELIASCVGTLCDVEILAEL